MPWQSDSSSAQCRWFPAAAAAAATGSLDLSTSHSDTGDVLIRSTRLSPGRATEPGSVHMIVERVQADPVTKRLRPPKTPLEPDKGRPLSAVALRLGKLPPNSPG